MSKSYENLCQTSLWKRTNLSPFLLLMKRYESSKAVEGTTFLCTLSSDGKQERTGFVLIKKKCDIKNRHFTLYLYPLCLRDHTL